MFKGFVEQKKNYRENKYQTAITTQLYSRTEKTVAVMIAPSDGKTFIELALAKLHKAAGQDVIVVTADELNRQ